MSYIVYSKPGCPACDSAKNLLKSKNLNYQEIILDVGQSKEDGKAYISRDELLQKVPGARTVPQIFNGEQHIGGFSELMRAV